MNDDPLLLISLAFDILNSNVCSCTLDIDTGLLSINHHINADECGLYVLGLRNQNSIRICKTHSLPVQLSFPNPSITSKYEFNIIELPDTDFSESNVTNEIKSIQLLCNPISNIFLSLIKQTLSGMKSLLEKYAECSDMIPLILSVNISSEFTVNNEIEILNSSKNSTLTKGKWIFSIDQLSLFNLRLQNFGDSGGRIQLTTADMLCEFAGSRLGRSTIQKWLTSTSWNVKEAVNQRHHPIHTLMRNIETATKVHALFKKITSISPIIMRLRTFAVTPRDWKVLGDLCLLAIEILTSLPAGISPHKDFSQIYLSCLKRTVEIISSNVDIQKTIALGKFEPVRGVDEHYDKMQVELQYIDQLLIEMSQEEAQRLQILIAYHHEVSFCRVSQRGFKLRLPKQQYDKITLPNDVMLDFIDGEWVYLTSAVSQEVDREVGDLSLSIERRRDAIVSRLLQDLLLPLTLRLTEIWVYLAELDALIACAMAAREFNWRLPYIPGCNDAQLERDEHKDVITNSLYLPALMHPVLPHCSQETWIPSSVSLEARPHLLVGLPSSGRSSLVTACGTAILLAMAGLPIPCEETATIPHVGSLVVRGLVAGAESMETLQASSFQRAMKDLAGVERLLDTSNSQDGLHVVLLDGVVKGTAQADALALIAGILNMLKETRATAIVTANVELDLIEEIDLDEFAVSVMTAEKSQPLFEFRHIAPHDVKNFIFTMSESISSSTFGVAAQAGIPMGFLHRARRILEAMNNKYEFPSLELEDYNCESNKIFIDCNLVHKTRLNLYRELLDTFLGMSFETETDAKAFSRFTKEISTKIENLSARTITSKQHTIESITAPTIKSKFGDHNKECMRNVDCDESSQWHATEASTKMSNKHLVQQVTSHATTWDGLVSDEEERVPTSNVGRAVSPSLYVNHAANYTANPSKTTSSLREDNDEEDDWFFFEDRYNNKNNNESVARDTAASRKRKEPDEEELFWGLQEYSPVSNHETPVRMHENSSIPITHKINYQRLITTLSSPNHNVRGSVNNEDVHTRSSNQPLLVPKGNSREDTLLSKSTRASGMNETPHQNLFTELEKHDRNEKEEFVEEEKDFFLLWD